ncbi:MAG: aldo/keto reductase [Acidimicrobiia bacterium]|nr:aldo/keto reductase [Acidimicrobiia bacterium]
MQSRPLGETGLEVTRLGLGLAALGRPGYLNLGHGVDLAGRRTIEALEQHTHDVLDKARQAGIRYVDAARSYGRAEAFLASWLATRNIAPGEITVSSKWGYRYTAGWRIAAETHEIKDLTVGHLDSQYQETLRLLCPHLKLYQIHSATLDVLSDRAVLERLAAIRGEGAIIGLSASGPWQSETIRRAIDIEVDGARLFGTIQATWNLLEPSTGPILAKAHADGVGVIVKEALANGRLTTRDRTAAARLRQWRPGVAPDVAALAAALAQPWADVVLSGAATVDQLSSNLEALTVEPGELPAMAESPELYWSKRSSLTWT